MTPSIISKYSLIYIYIRHLEIALCKSNIKLPCKRMIESIYRVSNISIKYFNFRFKKYRKIEPSDLYNS